MGSIGGWGCATPARCFHLPHPTASRSSLPGEGRERLARCELFDADRGGVERGDGGKLGAALLGLGLRQLGP